MNLLKISQDRNELNRVICDIEHTIGTEVARAAPIAKPLGFYVAVRSKNTAAKIFLKYSAAKFIYISGDSLYHIQFAE